MGLRLTPRDDPALARRVRRQLMGFASYLMFLLPLAYAVPLGGMAFDWRGLLVFLLLGVTINLGFMLAIRSGWSARFKDPSLTFAQILGAVAMALAMIHFAIGEVRTILLMLFVASLFFGVFGLSKRQFLVLSSCAVGGYLVLALWETRGRAWSDPAVRLEGLRLMTLAMILLWLSLLGSYVAGLRARLERRNQELDNALGRLKQLVSHDELTGVFNRRHLMNILGRERERAERYGHGFSIALIDLDHFKLVNDRHGHAAGDDVLRGFAARVLACARRMDWVGRQGSDEGGDTTFGRYGGEEFLLVLPHTTEAGAHRCVGRLREAVNASAFDTVAGPLAVTFSAGLAEYRKGEPVASTLNRADEALYRAKDLGRNRTEGSEGGGQPATPA